MTTNKDAQDCLDELCDWAVQGHIYNSVLERCRDTLINALQTQAELVEALSDCLSGYEYIKENHVRLYGVGVDRCIEKSRKALARAEGKE